MKAMQVTKNTMISALLVGSALLTQQAMAEGVQIFTGAPPSADELAAMMFPEQENPQLRTRSIVFIDPNNTAPAKPVKKAKAQKKRVKKVAKKAKKSKKYAKKKSYAKQVKKVTAKRVQKAAPKKVARATQNSGGFGFLINFALNSSAIMDDSKPYLDQVGKMMHRPEAKGQVIVIEGHTDASGSETYNKELSVERAKAVKAYLVSQHKVDPKQLVTLGKGESELLPEYSPHDGMNRRVQFHRAEG